MNNATQWRYRRFAAEFFLDCDAPAAYTRAGFKARTPAAVYTDVSRLMRNADVQRYLAEEFSRLQGRLALDQDRHAEEVTHVSQSMKNRCFGYCWRQSVSAFFSIDLLGN
jgi:hypothetical protein